MKQKRILAFLLTFVMVLSLMPTNIVFAEETTTTDIFAGGDGSESAPYQIATLEQLEAFRDSVNGGTSYEGDFIRLDDDIVLNGNESNQWVMIGDYDKGFKGVFDGNNKTISGLYAQKTSGSSNYYGFFGSIKNATVKNLTVNGEISTTDDTTVWTGLGGVVGCAGNSKIENCTGNVTINVGSKTGYVGGLVGYAGNGCTISNSTNKGNVYGTNEDSYIGGICGLAFYTTIDGCTNEGNVNGKKNVGGIAGDCNDATIKYCANKGSVAGIGDTGENVGGIAGHIWTGTAVINSCYNIGNVSGTKYVGGIVGYGMAGNINNTYNVGTVTGKDYVGGIAGYLPYTSENWGAQQYYCCINQAYNVGDIVGETENVGEIYGAIDTTNNKVEVNNTYTLDGTEATYNSFGEQSKFSGFDFTDTWVMSTTGIAERPLLKSNTEVIGTENNPHRIATLKHLENFRNSVNGGNTYGGKYIKLLANIDMSSKYGADINGSEVSWTPIGSEDNKFKGIFDGNGHKITGLYINDNTSSTGYRGFGLFGVIEDATIKNLACVSGSVTVNRNKDRAGGIVGCVRYDKTTGSTISNCCSAVNVTGTENGNVGGIAGVASMYTFITDCCNTGNISGRTAYIGGIVGEISTLGEVKNCYNTGNVTSTNGNEGAGAYIGGIAGDSSSNVNNCYNTGTVTAQEGDGKVGGIVGNIKETETVTASYYIETSAGEHTTFDCMKGEEKSADDFASGEVAWLLQDGQSGQVWGQKLTGESTDSSPVLTSDADKKVYKVSFMQKDSENEGQYKEFTAAYANKDCAVASFPTVTPTADNYTFGHWAKTQEDISKTNEFTKNTPVSGDMSVYAVGKELTAASSESDTVSLRKGMIIAEPIELKKFVANKSGKESDNFVFVVSEDSELPAGITLNEADGTLEGKPTCNAGVYTVKFDVANNNGIALMSVDTAASTEAETLTIKLNIDLEQGSEANTYLINNLDELKYFRDSVNSGRTYSSSDTVKLNTDIELGGSENPWTPIGRNWQTCFYGTFDGAGHKVTGMYIPSVSEGENAGFFGAKSYGTIKNLGVEGDIIFTDGNNIGGIVGWNSGSAIINCYHKGKVEGSEASAVGGIAGWINNSGTINRCYNVGNATGGVVAHQICQMDGNTLFGSGSNNYYLATNDDGNGGKTEDQFKSGEVAWLLQNGQSEQVWGQHRVNTNVPKDDYPVLTSVESLKIYKLSFLKNNEGEGDYTAYDGKDKYLNKGDSLIAFPDCSSDLHIGWSETAGGEKLSLPYTFNKTEDTSLYSVWKGKVTFDIEGKNHTYAADTVRQISLTPKVNGAVTDKLSADDDFTVTYYTVDENYGGVDVSKGFRKPVSIGKYFYVIDFENDELKNDYYIDRFYDINNIETPEDEPGVVSADRYDNIGYMYITSGVENAQKPIYFEKQVVNAKMTDTVSNNLVNPNASTVTYTSSDTSVAAIDSDGKVTIKDAGSTVIVATSTKENASDVYASYSLNVTKEVITVTANDKSISYGDAFANDGYIVSKEGVTLSGTPLYTTDYNVGDGVGKYEINVSGLESDVYEIVYKSGKLKVEAKPLTADDFDVTVKEKTYDGSVKAEVTAKVKNGSLVTGDVVTVLASGTFDNANVAYSSEEGQENTVTEKEISYEISGLSGKDSNNYVLSGTISGKQNAKINPCKVTVSVPTATTYVFDGSEKSVSAVGYANGIYFDDLRIIYIFAGKPLGDNELPTNVGTYNFVVKIDDKNYEIENSSSAMGTIYIKSAQQDVFSIEGISDTVTYGDDDLTLQTAGAIEGGSVSYAITSGGEYATLSGNKIITNGVGTVTVTATCKKDNYVDKTATRTFVIKPKTISVTAEATNKVYDGTKNVEVTLTPDGVLSGDSVTVTNTSATVATADVENSKTVFVSGLSIDNPKYQLSATSVQTTVNITKKTIGTITATADGKVYDGTKAVTGYKIEIPENQIVLADKDFLKVSADAEFGASDVGLQTVKFKDLVLSGTKSGNYELGMSEVTNTAEITQATVSFELGTLSYVYDGKAKTVPVTATVGGKAFEGYKVEYKQGEQTIAKPTNAGTYDIEITLNDGINYKSDYTTTQKLVITVADQSEMTITGLLGTIEYGKTFGLNAVGGSGDISATWQSSDKNIATVNEAGVVTIIGVDKKVTITATKAANGNFNEQTASVTFTPVKKNVTIKITNLNQVYDGTPKLPTVTTGAGVTSSVKYFNESNQEVANPTNAGTYYVEVEATGNYEGEQSAVLTIKKARRNTDSISLTIPENIVYGTTYDVTVNGYDGTDGTITYTGTGLYGGQTEKPTNAGSYTATLTISNDNFETATVTKKFEIAKATLYAKPDDAARAYGAQNPVFTIKYYSDEACKNEVTNADVMIAPIMSTPATASTAAGEHKISATGGYAENYTFRYVDGTLTIDPITDGTLYITGSSNTVRVDDVFTLYAFYGNSMVNAVWSVKDDSPKDVIELEPETGKVTAMKSGTVTIIATADENYGKKTAEFTLNVKQTGITLTPINLVKTYNGDWQDISFANNADFTPEIGKNVTVEYTLISDPTVKEPVQVGTYSVVYTINNGSYTGGGNTTMYINKATVTAKVKDDTKVYGDEYTGYDIEITNNGGITNKTALAEVIANIKSTTSFASDGAEKTAVVKEGGYEMIPTLSATETSNVKFTVDKGTLTVNKAPLIIKVKDVSREYGTENPALEVEYTGFKNDETKDILSGELVLAYDESINAETAVGPYEDKTTASGLTGDNYEITFEQGDVEITKIAVNASAETSRASYLTVKFDKAVEGVTFTVKNGETPVEVTSTTASADNKTYTLNGTFTVGTEYTVEIAYNNATKDISNKTLKITPTKQSSGGGSSATTSYTVTFETNGGSKVDSVKVDKNKTVSEPTAPTKDGFEFDGWYSDKKLTTAYDFDTKVTKAITLYAKWTEKKPDNNKDDNNNPTPSDWKNPFADVTDEDWFFDSVRFVNESGLMSGMTDDEFAPNDTLTRGMLVTIFYRAAGEPEVNKSIPFSDVDASRYYADAVIWAHQNGIVSGVTENTFAPDENITREQIATIIYRYAQCMGIAPEGAWTVKLDYADVADISDFAVEGVMYCTMINIMQGKGSNMLAPKDNATRAEIAAILQRFIERNK